MGILQELFGNSRDRIWGQLAQQIGARFQEGGLWGTTAVQAQVGEWTVTLDHYTVSSGKSSVTYTRMRAPFLNRDGLRFEIYRTNFFIELFKFLGGQDIEVGFPEFDQAFVIKGSQPGRVQALFRNERLRGLLQAQPSIHFSLQHAPQAFRRQQVAELDQLIFHVVGIITDPYRLKLLFDLFAEVIHDLGHMDSGFEDDPNLHLRDLMAPGGQLREGNLVVWDGDAPRIRAAECLGRLRSPGALTPLAQSLNDPNPAVRLACIRALGELGNPWIVPTLIPFLGSPSWDEAACATDALRALGAGPLADDIFRALDGDEDAALRLNGPYRDRVLACLDWILSEGAPGRVGMCAPVLLLMGASDRVANLRKALRRLRRNEEQARAAVQEAIRELEVHATLPTPASAPAFDTSTLPLPADAEGGTE